MVLAITSHTRASECPLLRECPDSILLPAPIHEAEETSFGVAAPTTSTTVAMAVGDMLALMVAESIYEGRMGSVFKRNHPGGAIGDSARRKGAEEEERDGEEGVKRHKGLASPESNHG